MLLSCLKVHLIFKLTPKNEIRNKKILKFKDLKIGVYAIGIPRGLRFVICIFWGILLSSSHYAL